MGVRPLMGSVGDAFDNAIVKSFFASLECELLNRRYFKSKLDARLATFTWIEGRYNLRRRHSAIGYQSPVNSGVSQSGTAFGEDRGVPAGACTELLWVSTPVGHFIPKCHRLPFFVWSISRANVQVPLLFVKLGAAVREG